MVFGNILTQFVFGRDTPIDKRKNLPMFNTAITTLNGSSIATSTLLTQRKKQLMKWYLWKSGLLTGIVNKVVKKINEKVYFEPIDKRNGRNRIKQSMDFYEKNRFRKMLGTLLVDILVTGETYILKRGIGKGVVNKIISKELVSKGFPDNTFTRELMFKANFPDETDLTMRDIVPIASSTMENRYDQYEIREYLQRVAMNTITYSTDQIIHLKPFEVDGIPNGFTPLNTLITQLELDWFMWQNMTGVAKNGGQPDKLYSAEDVDVNSPAFQRIEQELVRYHGPAINRHGSLLLAGKVTVQELQQLDSMQFENMGIYIAGLVALQWDVPRSSIPFMSKEANTKEDTGGNSERDFYGSIEYTQDLLTETLNQQIWIPKFGTRMKFNKSYKHDQVIETQTQQQRLNNLTFINNEFGRVDKVLKPDYIIRYINGINEEIDEDDLQKKPEELLPIEGDNSQMRQGLKSNKDLGENSDKKNVVAKKKKEQDNIQDNKGKPTGLGKEEVNPPKPNFGEYPYNMT